MRGTSEAMSKTGRESTTRRVLYVEGNVDGTVGGSYFSLLYLVSGLDRTRYEPLVAFCAPTPLRSRFEAAGVRTIVRPLAPAVRLKGPVGRLSAKLVNLIRGLMIEPIRLARLMRAERVNLVHLNNSITRNHPWILAARAARIPCITHERGINDRYSFRTRLLARSLRAIICISAAVRAKMVDLGLGGLRLLVIHNGLDPSLMRRERCAKDIRSELGVAPEQKLIGIVGNIKPWKGQEVVVRAMGLLRERYPGVMCVLVGDTSQSELDYLHSIRNLAADLDVAERIVITGYRSDIADLVAALDIQVHASIAPEPFGRVLLEAMAFSKPLVASRDGAVPEIVVDGETGLLFQPGAPEDLARCLRQLLDDPAFAERLGRAGYARLQADFSITANVRQTQQLYREILGH